MSKFFITGGAGFIGSNIVKVLIENNYPVTVYDNLSTGYLDNIQDLDGLKFIKGDILDKNNLISSSKGHDIVLHLAANIGNIKSIKDPSFDSEVNILGTLNVLEACNINRIKKLIYSSSAAIFGELLYQPIDEIHPIEPDSPYGVSKLAAEKHCLWYGKHYGFSVTALRYFNVYGENQRYDQYGNVIPIWANSLLHNEPITIFDDGEQTRDFINVQDVAMANLTVATTDRVTGVYNIGSGTSISVNQLAKTLINIFDSKSEIIYRPKRLGEIKHCRADISKASEQLNFSTKTPLLEGLTNYYNWLKKNVHII